METGKLILAVAAVFSSLLLCAQDVIYKTNGTSIKVKVMEVNVNSVKYRLAGENNVGMGELNKSDIHHIQYENGTKEFYNTSTGAVPADGETKEYVPEKKPVPRTDYGKNIIAVNWFEFFFTNFAASYERVFPSGKFAVKIPFSFGLGGKPNEQAYKAGGYSTDFLQNKNYSSGLELNIYPYGQTRNTFYFGISGEVGSFNYYTDTAYTVYNSNPYGNNTHVILKHEGIHYSGLVHIGGYIGVSENFLIGAKFGFGFKREDTVVPSYTYPRVQCDLNFAYRF